MECPHGEPRGEIYCPLCRREKGLVWKPQKPVNSNSVRVGRNHPDTSHKAAQKALPNSGTKKKIIYDLIVASGMFGVCDHEIEETLGWTHQTASSSRNALMNDGWVIDSGHRRATKQGNDAIAWIAVL
ncbi:hypothetical protein UFOVP772_21 [uncultured Caudovirales phage]|jgi:uncharacterized Zn finger protein (UPF0148 family)|uniref:Helix-turn-helix domain containing protein n=1 Tax=uncultured Caudovirales phage TaxID=2100421 RepID=A0A6J5NQ58_9CAUD|nr:hypothetical protein UFOVP772_21 [uncultured Caudovirales phage]